jgi:TPR repeat protein
MIALPPLRALMAVALTAMLAACATTKPCPVGGMAALTCLADRGDKSAQLQLGIAYETGDGVPQNYERAARYFRFAAAPVSGTTFIYSPPVGKAPGQVIPVRTGADQPGLAEAQYRLAQMYRDGRGVQKDPARAERLFAQAAAQGFEKPPNL